jgi:hypothetical protein
MNLLWGASPSVLITPVPQNKLWAVALPLSGFWLKWITAPSQESYCLRDLHLYQFCVISGRNGIGSEMLQL